MTGYWINIDIDCHPQQIEFSRLELCHITVTSKRRLNQLVEQGTVDGWDDPQHVNFIRSLRRRGYPAAAIRDICEAVLESVKKNP